MAVPSFDGYGSFEDLNACLLEEVGDLGSSLETALLGLQSRPTDIDHSTKNLEILIQVAREKDIITKKEEYIFRVYYGIGTHKKKLNEIGDDVDLSRERVRNIRDEVQIKLKEFYESDGGYIDFSTNDIVPYDPSEFLKSITKSERDLPKPTIATPSAFINKQDSIIERYFPTFYRHRKGIVQSICYGLAAASLITSIVFFKQSYRYIDWVDRDITGDGLKEQGQIVMMQTPFGKFPIKKEIMYGHGTNGEVEYWSPEKPK